MQVLANTKIVLPLPLFVASALLGGAAHFFLHVLRLHVLANQTQSDKENLPANFYPGVHFMTRHELRETETYLMSDEGRLSSCTHSTRR